MATVFETVLLALFASTLAMATATVIARFVEQLRLAYGSRWSSAFQAVGSHARAGPSRSG